MSSMIDYGWLQCNQCGHGHDVTLEQVKSEEYSHGRSCPNCGTGIVKITWALKKTDKKNH